MDLFELDEKGKEKIEKYFKEAGRNEFKVTILIPIKLQTFIQGFNKEITPLYQQLINKDSLGAQCQEKIGQDYNENFFKKEILCIQIDFTKCIIKYLGIMIDLIKEQKVKCFTASIRTERHEYFNKELEILSLKFSSLVKKDPKKYLKEKKIEQISMFRDQLTTKKQ